MSVEVSRECAEFLQNIVYLIDDELAEDDVVEVRLHLEGCTPCHEQYDVQRAIKQIVARSCAERAPSELRARILVSLQQVEFRVEPER